MADPDTSGREPEWNEHRWEEVMELFSTSDPEEIVDRLQELRRQTRLLQDIRETVDADPTTDLVDAIESMNDREKKLQREFGVSNPDAVVEMVEGLTEQLEEPFEGADPEAFTTMMHNLTDQLDELYAEREGLAEFNLNGTDEALEMLESMQQQLEVLYERQEEMSEQGIDGMDHALSVIESMESQLSEVYEERTRTASTPSLSADDPLLPEDSLARLGDLPPDELDALPAGAFRLTDRGIVQDANAKALRWPDADGESSEALVGAHFFREVAPGTDNDLFRGRFEKGIDRGKMDAQFLYTYVSTQATATNLAVHLHRKPDQSVNWIVFRVLEQY